MRISQKLKNFYQNDVQSSSNDFQSSLSSDAKIVGTTTVAGAGLGAALGSLDRNADTVTIDSGFQQPFTSPFRIDLDWKPTDLPPGDSRSGPITAPGHPVVDLTPVEQSAPVSDSSFEVSSSVIQGAAYGAGAGFVAGIAYAVLNDVARKA